MTYTAIYREFVQLESMEDIIEAIQTWDTYVNLEFTDQERLTERKDWKSFVDSMMSDDSQKYSLMVKFQEYRSDRLRVDLYYRMYNRFIHQENN